MMWCFEVVDMFFWTYGPRLAESCRFCQSQHTRFQIEPFATADGADTTKNGPASESTAEWPNAGFDRRDAVKCDKRPSAKSQFACAEKEKKNGWLWDGLPPQDKREVKVHTNLNMVLNSA